MIKLKSSEVRVQPLPNTEHSVIIHQGEQYTVVFNDYLVLGGDHYILDSGFAFETE